MDNETKHEVHLWEINHPYYCTENNYFRPGNSPTQTVTHFKAWGDFFEEYKDADFDYNLLFRFDWQMENEDGKPIDYTTDPYYRAGTLTLFYFIQRKGYHQTKIIDVCAADEPAVKAFLKERWEHMRHLWQGISGFIKADSEP